MGPWVRGSGSLVPPAAVRLEFAHPGSSLDGDSGSDVLAWPALQQQQQLSTREGVQPPVTLLGTCRDYVVLRLQLSHVDCCRPDPRHRLSRSKSLQFSEAGDRCHNVFPRVCASYSERWDLSA